MKVTLVIHIIITLLTTVSTFGERPRTYPDASQIKEIINSDTSNRYTGQQGYINMAIDHFNSNLHPTYKNTSRAVNKATFSSLSWEQAYEGSVNDYTAERELLLKTHPNGEYVFKGINGYISYAKEKYAGSMLKAFKNMKAALTTIESRALSWGKAYSGSVDNYTAERKLLLKRHPNGEYVYKGINGYMSYAKEKHAGAMLKAFTNMSAVLTLKEVKALSWGKQYNGSIDNYVAERELLLETNSNGEFLFKGIKGYISYAKEHYAGAMLKAFKNMSAILTPEEMKALSIGKQFNGSAEETVTMRELLFGIGEKNYEKGINKWHGQFTGLDAIVNEYLLSIGHELPFNKKSVIKVRRNFRASVSEKEIIKLKWSTAKKSSVAKSRSCKAMISINK